MHQILHQIKKSIVFIGNETKYIGTGSLLSVGFPFSPQKTVCFLITARHVVSEAMNSNQNIWVSFNRKNGTIGKTSIKEIENQFGVRWLFHENEEVDIALIPFPINPETDDVMLIPNELFGSFEKLSELYEVFYLSFQPGVSRYGRVEPIIRTGVISFLDNDNKIFYIDGFVFPGNSGGPVFVKPSPIRFDNNDIVIGGNDPLGWKMVGVINSLIYSSLPVEGNLFYNNTGLSIVRPIDFVNEILSQDSSKRLLEKIVERERTKE